RVRRRRGRGGGADARPRPRRRQGGRDPQPPACLPRGDGAAARPLPVDRGDRGRRRRHRGDQRPRYGGTGQVAVGFARRRVVPFRTAGELDAMAAAGAVVGRTLVAVRDAARPGVSTLDLDRIAEETIRAAGAVPSFLGYHGFTGSICASRNEVVVHGIPRPGDVLAEGDLLSIDCGAILDGWHGGSAWTFSVGGGTPAEAELNSATEKSLAAGIAAMVPGNRLTDVSHAIENGTRAAEKAHGRTYGIVDGYGGHGIGREMHMDPFL